jgi:hypothetical protein
MQIRVLLQPLLRLDEFQRVCARGQDLAQERIRVQRNRSDQGVQLFPGKKRRWAFLRG